MGPKIHSCVPLKQNRFQEHFSFGVPEGRPDIGAGASDINDISLEGSR